MRWAAVAVAIGLFGAMPAVVSAQAAQSTVVVEQFDFGFKPAPVTVNPGGVTFAVKNTGTRPHELVVVRSDLDPTKLPLKDGRVDEAAVQIVGRLPRVMPPDVTTGVLNLDLAQGRYVVICNIGTHYARGMQFSLGVGVPALAFTPLVFPAAATPAPAAPAPAATGNGGPLVADIGSPVAPLALGILALALVTLARVSAWRGED
jgi:plastocyanin